MVKKKDLRKNKTEEGMVAFEEVLSKTERFIEDKQKILVIVISAIVIIILAYFGYQKFYIAPLEEEAQSQIFMAETYYQNDSIDKALYGDGNYLGFIDIIDEYGPTKSASLANYYAGLCFMKKGEFETAIHHLKRFDGDDMMVSSMAIGVIGDAYIELNKPEKAVNFYLQAANNHVNDFLTPVFLMKAGWAYEDLGEYDKALRNYKRIKNEFDKSYESRDIEKYIIRAENKSNFN
ncbi:MAG: tetratricopeptide repeat protein [Bacteroidales bacterium]|nr:tetratricopeptide repeat protein [Bacteroidales bacterium]